MYFIMIFLEGIASFISPCILPLVPIYVSYFAGKEEKKTSKTIINSIGFVIGFTIVFTMLAIVSNRLGSIVYGSQKYIRIVFGIITIALGLIYMDVVKFNIFSKFKKFSMNTEGLNFIKAIILGMLFSISMTPCLGIFLTSALILVASETEFYKGVLLIIAFSLGLGIPFIVSSFLIDKLKRTFNFIKAHYGLVKKISSIVLIVMGLYIIFMY